VNFAHYNLKWSFAVYRPVRCIALGSGLQSVIKPGTLREPVSTFVVDRFAARGIVNNINDRALVSHEMFEDADRATRLSGFSQSE
jgi:hypothetical protein